MQILPAIDLRDGKCVRLIQGRYDKQINYDDDPSVPARKFALAGAKILHVIDLDGAKAGRSENRDAVMKIVSSVDIPVELGGGIRSEDTIRDMIENVGVSRVILGTAAINNFTWLEEMAARFPRKIVLSVDAKGAQIATEGWTEDSKIQLLDLAKKAAGLPLAAIIYTDIDRDGMLSGPNLERAEALVRAVDMDIIAAGGVTRVEDIRKLAAVNVAGAVIGRALYEGTITIEEALAAADE